MVSDGSQLERLQKLIAQHGLASRREAETWILQGRVTVNGQPAYLGQRADLRCDQVAIDNRPLKPDSRPPMSLAEYIEQFCETYGWTLQQVLERTPRQLEVFITVHNRTARKRIKEMKRGVQRK